jgi:hypothetical protein
VVLQAQQLWCCMHASPLIHVDSRGHLLLCTCLALHSLHKVAKQLRHGNRFPTSTLLTAHTSTIIPALTG